MGQFKVIPERARILEKIPDYAVDITPCGERVQVTYQGEVIADSSEALLITETKHDPVYYFPRRDVRVDKLQPTSHSTYCPFKGDASYWSLALKDQAIENLVWSYEAPYEEVLGLKDYMAFYSDRTQIDFV